MWSPDILEEGFAFGALPVQSLVWTAAGTGSFARAKKGITRQFCALSFEYEVALKE